MEGAVISEGIVDRLTGRQVDRLNTPLPLNNPTTEQLGKGGWRER